MHDGFHHPCYEDAAIEKSPLNAIPVQGRGAQSTVHRNVTVENSQGNDGSGREQYISELINDIFVDWLTGKQRHCAVEKLGQHQHGTLVEYVFYNCGYAPIIKTAVHKEKIAKETELSDGVVAIVHSLLAL